MKLLISTSDVPARDRFNYWHDVACQTIIQHDARPKCRPSFQASLQIGDLATAGVLLFENSPMDATRTARQIACETADELFICRQIFGNVVFEQNGQRALLEPGDVILLDPQLPCGCRFPSDSNMLLLKVPRRELEARLGQTREMVLCPIKRSGPEGELTSSLIAMLPPYIGRMRPAVEETVKDQVLDLFALSLTQALGTQRPNVSSARSLAAMRLRAVIEARLSDPSLTAGSVAAAAEISVRYANSLLARDGTSIMRLIQTRRLERCRRSLEDPFQAHRTLTEIAYCWGFSDMTHFGRRFKATYGMLPREYRILAKNAGFVPQGDADRIANDAFRLSG